MDWAEGDGELWCRPDQAPADRVGSSLSSQQCPLEQSHREPRWPGPLHTGLLTALLLLLLTSPSMLPVFQPHHSPIHLYPSVPLYRLLFAWNMLCPFLSSNLLLLYLFRGRINLIVLCIHPLQYQLHYITLLISSPYSPRHPRPQASRGQELQVTQLLSLAPSRLPGMK